jgi:hypothetical protein
VFDINITLGPINVGITTDERLSVDLMDMLVGKAVIQAMILDESHLGNMVKYDNYDNDNDVDCDECSTTTEELD